LIDAAVFLPEVARVVPTEGPLHGGIEVTVLGSNFYSKFSPLFIGYRYFFPLFNIILLLLDGVHVMFGENEAFSTHYWGPTTLICLLPPSVTPGLVPVTIKESRFSSTFNSPSAGVLPGGDEASGMSSSPSRQELDFVDAVLNTDIVMFNYRDGQFHFIVPFFFFWTKQ
jgi:hypothetical protein